MHLTPRLLCISNGHGEDTIALRILMALRSRLPQLELAALPLVGEGTSFRKQEIPLIAATQTLPSGGFIYMDGRQLARDLQGGLVQLTRLQLSALKTWGQEGGTVLAVGDLIPFLFAWWSRLPYALVGTAKSAYYLRDEQGQLPGLPWYTGWAGSIYLPWERWLMTRDRCRAMVVRDELTAAELQQLGVAAVSTGNPMMDGLEPTEQFLHLKAATADTLTVLLLPGSRAPEAYENWQLMLPAVASVIQQFQPRPVQFLGAIAPALDLATFAQALQAADWQADSTHPDDLSFLKETGRLTLTQTAYTDCLHLAEAAIAMAGTATEQFVGLGKPAFILPGKGPQFNPVFAKLQTRLLGCSVVLVEQPDSVGTSMEAVLGNTVRLAAIAQNGHRRLGDPGAAEAIADVLVERLIR
ncbi:MAG: lipid-A-disaccharide synthase-related protein [Cyanobacteria bacterium J06638_28]